MMNVNVYTEYLGMASVSHERLILVPIILEQSELYETRLELKVFLAACESMMNGWILLENVILVRNNGSKKDNYLVGI